MAHTISTTTEEQLKAFRDDLIAKGWLGINVDEYLEFKNISQLVTCWPR